MSKADDELFGLKSLRTGEYLHSKSADEMFKELGYEKRVENDNIIYTHNRNRYKEFVFLIRKDLNK